MLATIAFSLDAQQLLEALRRNDDKLVGALANRGNRLSTQSTSLLSLSNGGVLRLEVQVADGQLRLVAELSLVDAHCDERVLPALFGGVWCDEDVMACWCVGGRIVVVVALLRTIGDAADEACLCHCFPV